MSIKETEYKHTAITPEGKPVTFWSMSKNVNEEPRSAYLQWYRNCTPTGESRIYYWEDYSLA